MKGNFGKYLLKIQTLTHNVWHRSNNRGIITMSRTVTATKINKRKQQQNQTMTRNMSQDMSIDCHNAVDHM